MLCDLDRSLSLSESHVLICMRAGPRILLSLPPWRSVPHPTAPPYSDPKQLADGQKALISWLSTILEREAPESWAPFPLLPSFCWTSGRTDISVEQDSLTLPGKGSM